MKKLLSFYLLFIASFLFFLTSCKDDEIMNLSADKHEISDYHGTHYLPYEQALEKALYAIYGDKQTRAQNIRVKEHHEYVAHKATYNDGDSIDVRFHVINFDNNAGFALVSADNRTTPIYAFSNTGSLDLENAIKNTGIKEFMDGAAKLFREELRGNPGGGLIPIPIDSVPDFMLSPIVSYNNVDCYAYSTHSTFESPILTNTEWNQCHPYNAACPYVENPKIGYNGKAAAGCATIATAQIIAYHQYPSSFNGITFDWNAITAVPYYNPYCNLTPAAESIAQFVYQVAVSLNVVFGVTSSCSTLDTYNTLQSWGYATSQISEFNIQNIKSSLINGWPVYCRGESSTVGHAWVIDSYRKNTHKTTYYEVAPPHVIAGIQASDTYYYHCNWGWGGTYNGYFYGGAFNTNVGSFNNDNQIIYNIHPNN